MAKNAVDETKQEDPVSQELLDKLDRGEVKLDSLDAGTQKRVEAIILASGELPDEGKTDVPVTPEPTPKPDEKPAEGEAPKPDGVPGEIPKDKKSAQQYAWEKAQEANRFKQQNETLAKRLEALEKQQKEWDAKQAEIAAKKTEVNPDSLWDDDAQVALRQELSQLREQVKNLSEGHQNTLAAERKALEVQKAEIELNSFQEEFPDLKLGRPFEKVNQEYARWYGAFQSDADRDRYLADPAFREQMKGKVPELPAEHEKYMAIREVQEFKEKNGFKDLGDAYLSFIRKNGRLREVLAQERLQGTMEVLDRVSGRATESRTLSPGDGGSSSGPAMTEAQAMAWLAAHPYGPARGNAEDARIWEQVQALIHGVSSGV